MKHALFAKTDIDFIEVCKVVNIDPSKRQASKWRRGMGLAWNWKKRRHNG